MFDRRGQSIYYTSLLYPWPLPRIDLGLVRILGKVEVGVQIVAEVIFVVDAVVDDIDRLEC